MYYSLIVHEASLLLNHFLNLFLEPTSTGQWRKVFFLKLELLQFDSAWSHSAFKSLLKSVPGTNEGKDSAQVNNLALTGFF